MRDAQHRGARAVDLAELLPRRCVPSLGRLDAPPGVEQVGGEPRDGRQGGRGRRCPARPPGPRRGPRPRRAPARGRAAPPRTRTGRRPRRRPAAGPRRPPRHTGGPPGAAPVRAARAAAANARRRRSLPGGQASLREPAQHPLERAPTHSAWPASTSASARADAGSPPTGISGPVTALLRRGRRSWSDDAADRVVDLGVEHGRPGARPHPARPSPARAPGAGARSPPAPRRAGPGTARDRRPRTACGRPAPSTPARARARRGAPPAPRPAPGRPGTSSWPEARRAGRSRPPVVHRLPGERAVSRTSVARDGVRT